MRIIRSRLTKILYSGCKGFILKYFFSDQFLCKHVERLGSQRSAGDLKALVNILPTGSVSSGIQLTESLWKIKIEGLNTGECDMLEID